MEARRGSHWIGGDLSRRGWRKRRGLFARSQLRRQRRACVVVERAEKLVYAEGDDGQGERTIETPRLIADALEFIARPLMCDPGTAAAVVDLWHSRM